MPPRLTIEEMHHLAEHKGGKCLSTQYKNANTHLTWECSEGHQWDAIPAQIKKGHWCPYCNARNLSEEKCRYILQSLTGHFFKKTQTVLPERLELDGYCEELNCAFEYNGKQHYKPISIFHRCHSIDKVKERDALKVSYCSSLGISIIVIPYFENTGDEVLVQFIRKELDRCGVPFDSSASVDFNQFCQSFGSHKYDELQGICNSKGGKCLSCAYLGVKSKHLFECSEGHQWETTPDSVKQGQWCPECGNAIRASKSRLPFSVIQKLARSKGGRCLSTHYINNRTPLLWECSEGHQWNSTSGNVSRGSWCPTCGHQISWFKRKVIKPLLDFNNPAYWYGEGTFQRPLFSA